MSVTMSEGSLCVDIPCAQLLENIIKNENFKTYIVKVAPGSEPGDGYVGINNAVEIISEDKVLKLFIKAAPVSAKSRELEFLNKIFVNEAFFYKTLHPEFLKFQNDRGTINPFNSVPKCYDASTEYLKEALVMENLKEQGYATYDRKSTMNEEHISFVFKQFAKFHAVSFAMKDQDCVLYDRLSANLGDIWLENMKEYNLDKLFVNYCENVKEMFATDNFISIKIQNLTEILMEVFENCSNNLGRFSVITQCDCWCNNMMFKYKDDVNRRIPSDIKLIDWQIIKVNYPVFDLSYFFYTVCSKQIMADVDKYLKIYHDQLSESIRELGSDPDILYPYSVFIEQWTKFCKYGLLMSFMLIKIMLTEKDEVVKMEDAPDKKDMSNVFNYKLKNEAVYVQRIRDLLEHFIDKEYL